MGDPADRFESRFLALRWIRWPAAALLGVAIQLAILAGLSPHAPGAPFHRDDTLALIVSPPAVSPMTEPDIRKLKPQANRRSSGHTATASVTAETPVMPSSERGGSPSGVQIVPNAAPPAGLATALARDPCKTPDLRAQHHECPSAWRQATLAVSDYDIDQLNEHRSEELASDFHTDCWLTCPPARSAVQAAMMPGDRIVQPRGGDIAPGIPNSEPGPQKVRRSHQPGFGD